MSPSLAIEAKIGSDENLEITANNCPYDSVILSADGNFVSYEWNNSSTNQTLTIYETGDYSVTAYDDEAVLQRRVLMYLQSYRLK